MNDDVRHHLPRIPRLLIAAVLFAVVASLAVVAFTEHRTRVDAEDYAAYLGDELSAARSDLADAEADADATQDSLDRTRSDLVTSRSELRTSQAANARLTSRHRACAVLVRINDHLLAASLQQSHATGAMMRDRDRAARTHVTRASGHVKAVQSLVERSGHRTISGVVNACAPPVH